MGWNAAFKRLVAENNPDLVEHAPVLGLDLDESVAVNVLRGMVRDADVLRDVRQRMLSARRNGTFQASFRTYTS